MYYTAPDIAQYIITYCNQHNIAISNLKLQKVLYFLWIEYFKKTSQPLFEDNFCAWQLGPVIPNVYFEYCAFGGLPIHRVYPIKLPPEHSRIIDGILEKYCNISPSQLVDMSHRPGRAWEYIFSNYGNKAVMPYEIIKSKECE